MKITEKKKKIGFEESIQILNAFFKIVRCFCLSQRNMHKSDRVLLHILWIVHNRKALSICWNCFDEENERKQKKNEFH